MKNPQTRFYLKLQKPLSQQSFSLIFQVKMRMFAMKRQRADVLSFWEIK